MFFLMSCTINITTKEKLKDPKNKIVTLKFKIQEVHLLTYFILFNN